MPCLCTKVRAYAILRQCISAHFSYRCTCLPHWLCADISQRLRQAPQIPRHTRVNAYPYPRRQSGEIGRRVYSNHFSCPLGCFSWVTLFHSPCEFGPFAYFTRLCFCTDGLRLRPGEGKGIEVVFVDSSSDTNGFQWNLYVVRYFHLIMTFSTYCAISTPVKGAARRVQCRLLSGTPDGLLVS